MAGVGIEGAIVVTAAERRGLEDRCCHGDHSCWGGGGVRVGRAAGLSRLLRLLKGDAENGQRCGVVVAFTAAELRGVVEYGRHLMLGGGAGMGVPGSPSGRHYTKARG